MANSTIRVRGARTHNLKNIDSEIPRNTLTVITGLSGSGKSSLAFDTIYAEGQRRYVESLSAYARQFLSMMEKPDVDYIDGLSPTIAIEQKSTSHNPRSTVGTTTEIYDYLRLLFARVGTPRCPEHGEELTLRTVSEMVDSIIGLTSQYEGVRMMLLAPVVRAQKGTHKNLLNELRASGYVRARINNTIYDLDSVPELEKNLRHNIEVVVDRFRIRTGIEGRLSESLETTLQLTQGLVQVESIDKDAAPTMLMSSHFNCPICDYSLDELEPKLFSFNNPAGACPNCEGLGKKRYVDSNKLILDTSMSLVEGVIVGWGSNHSWHYHLITTVAEHYHIPLTTPWQELTAEQQALILDGTSESLEFVYRTEQGRIFRRNRPFKGVLKSIEHRFLETESGSVREDLLKLMSYQSCAACNGTRLNRKANHVFIDNKPLADITSWSILGAHEWSSQLQLKGNKAIIAQRILQEISSRLGFLCNVGLEYLTLDRNADTLSGGESQRIRLASQVGTGLTGVTYVLDEPSIGLHQRDNTRLLSTLCNLRDLGNTVLVVEHDEEAIRAADHVLDLGPGAGVHGGTICASGTPEDIIANPKSLTGSYLSGKQSIQIPSQRVKAGSKWLKLTGATGNNLKQVDLEIPLGLLTCITGVSGSGKSSLINQTLLPLVASRLNRATRLDALAFEQLKGLEHLDKVVGIDQSPIGRTPRSNPATYTGLFTLIRELFASTNEAGARGYKPGRFSFNVSGGRCEGCKGDGMVKVEMHFLADIYVTCEHCSGKRYNRETLEVKYKDLNIHQILDMTVVEAREIFTAIPSLNKKLKTLEDVGLGYIRLGQPATTLSGGEAQRIKLARELSRTATGKTLYLLDEPTTGLHFKDIDMLLSVLHRLRDKGNTLIIIEHNLDVIKTADWMIDMGPEGGAGGGEILFAGVPESIQGNQRSHTARFLTPLLNRAAALPLQKAISNS
ncbi:MAG: excinuclease ABC subunit UvrA [Gammaproteobacteria bacterium]